MVEQAKESAMATSNTNNIFASVLTYAAPTSNYRGESEENRTVLQKITKQGHEYPVISPEAMRNAVREMLATRGLPCNRRRLLDEDQLAVEFESFPDAEKYADDFLFGFMVADQKAIKAAKGKPAKRDSVLRMNLAVALEPYRFNATLHQSPANLGASPWKNAANSALLHSSHSLGRGTSRGPPASHLGKTAFVSSVVLLRELRGSPRPTLNSWTRTRPKRGASSWTTGRRHRSQGGVNGPAIIVEVEHRLDGDQVHVASEKDSNVPTSRQ
jgi:hypothetical protein